MKGIYLKESVKLFGFKYGLSFWFRMNFADPIQMFYWLNISHKPYCTYSGFHCRNENCKYKHLLTKKEIKEEWAKMREEMSLVETGENGKCCYCGEYKGEIEIDNPNFDKINRWLVCKHCEEVIKLQQELSFPFISTKRALEINDRLLEISKETKLPILTAAIEKDKEGEYHSTVVEFTGK